MLTRQLSEAGLEPITEVGGWGAERGGGGSWLTRRWKLAHTRQVEPHPKQVVVVVVVVAVVVVVIADQLLMLGF